MTPIYFTDNVIKVKCISNTDKDNKQHIITIGDIYNAFLNSNGASTQQHLISQQVNTTLLTKLKLQCLPNYL